ncbi:MAG: hypothetical protein IKX88_00110 [Thermoguttaceae bacterium]|nr:hypothetical protein [Thermoguttaceae bacterium]
MRNQLKSLILSIALLFSLSAGTFVVAEDGDVGAPKARAFKTEVSFKGPHAPQLDRDGRYLLHEGHDSVPVFSGSLFDPESADYLSVVLPALPDGYESIVTFGGDAKLGSDYLAYVPSTYYPESLYNGYAHSGSAKTVSIKILDDRQTESNESFTMTIGTPIAKSGVEAAPYIFDPPDASVSGTIIDNDGWKIGIVYEDGSDSGDVVVMEADEDQTNLRVKRIDVGFKHGSDLHYPIDATIAISGDADPSDYQLLLLNANETLTPIRLDGRGRFTVRIQDGEQFATVVVKAINDSIVERFEETLTFSVVEAKSYPPFIKFATDPTSLTVKIRDDDKLSLNTVQFKNNLNLVSDSEESFGKRWQNAVHWQGDSPLRTLPVAYSGDAIMSCNVTVSGQRDYSQTCQVRMKWNYGEGTACSAWATVCDNSAELDLKDSFAELFGRPKAYCAPEAILEWEFRTTSEETRGRDGDMGSSVNPLYVTYKAPTNVSCLCFHSLVHLGCLAASSADGGDEQVFQALWNMIASKSITKVKLSDGAVVDDEPLYYYGRDISPDVGVSSSEVKNTLSATYYPTLKKYDINQRPSLARQVELDSRNPYGSGLTVNTLLRYKDGTCGTWQDFAVNLCGIQGLKCVRVDVVVNDETYNALKIKPTLVGQGKTIPRENSWNGHALFQYGENVYDPSYGLPYGPRNRFLTVFASNLHSIGTETPVTYGEYGWTYIVGTADNLTSFLEDN